MGAPLVVSFALALACVHACVGSPLLVQVAELSRRAAIAKGTSTLAPEDALSVLHSAASTNSRLSDELESLLFKSLWSEDGENFDHFDIVFEDRRTMGIMFEELRSGGLGVKQLSPQGYAQQTGRVKPGDQLVAINLEYVQDMPIIDVGDLITEGAYPKVYRFRRKRPDQNPQANSQQTQHKANEGQQGPPSKASAKLKGKLVTKHGDGTFSVQVVDLQNLGLSILDDLSISGVKPQSPFHRIVQVGDHLEAVDGVNVVNEQLADVVRRIKSATPPFMLKLRYDEERDFEDSSTPAQKSSKSTTNDSEADDEDGPPTHLGAEGELVITSPPILAGAKYPIQFATFGEASTCEERNISMHVDAVNSGRLGMGCSRSGPAEPYSLANSVVFVLRGECTFVTKARNINKAGGQGMIVVTRDFEPVTTMPAGAGELRLGPVQGPAAMISWKDGNGLLGLLRKGLLRAKIRGPHCSDDDARPTSMTSEDNDGEEFAIEDLGEGRTRKRHKMTDGVELLLWDSVSGETYHEIGVLGQIGGFKYADYPTVSLAEPKVATFAPGDGLGCEAFANAADFQGAIVAVYRGECSFGDKAVNIQKAGGIGMIVINTDPGLNKLYPLMVPPDMEAAVKIPGIMISKEAGVRLRELLVPEGGEANQVDQFGMPVKLALPLIIAKFFRKSFYYCNRNKGILCGTT